MLYYIRPVFQDRCIWFGIARLKLNTVHYKCRIKRWKVNNRIFEECFTTFFVKSIKQIKLATFFHFLSHKQIKPRFMSMPDLVLTECWQPSVWVYLQYLVSLKRQTKIFISYRSKYSMFNVIWVKRICMKLA